jgi:hypothetical protein
MATYFGYIRHLQAIIYNQLIDLRYIHQNCVGVVPPEDGQVMPETCWGFEF